MEQRLNFKPASNWIDRSAEAKPFPQRAESSPHLHQHAVVIPSIPKLKDPLHAQLSPAPARKLGDHNPCTAHTSMCSLRYTSTRMIAKPPQSADRPQSPGSIPFLSNPCWGTPDNGQTHLGRSSRVDNSKRGAR